MNSTKSHYKVDLSRILQDLNEVNSFTTSYKDNPRGITRRSFTNEDSKARLWLVKKLEDLNLDVNVDGFGNVTATTKNSGKKVVVGSHLDTIPNGGRFDGILGVVTAIEVLRVIKENNIQLDKRIELVAFTDEEERFYGFLGSYAYVGVLDDINLDKIKDSDGFLLKEEMEKQGFDLKTAVKNSGTNLKEIDSFVELHIEQGPLLENKKIDIGVVDKVKGNWRYCLTVTGKTDHAGFPMQFREDAYLTLNEILHKAYQKSKEFLDEGLLFTVGKIELSTNLANVAPGKAKGTIDLRVDDITILEKMDLFIKQLAKESSLEVEVDYILKLDPTNFDEKVCKAIEDSCTKLNLSSMRISSGAGHDAQVLATKVPSAMIFVPSVEGRSHCPEELTLDSDIEKGSLLLLETLLSLAQ